MKKEAICAVCKQRQDVPVNPSERTCRFCGNTVLIEVKNPPPRDVPNGCSVMEDANKLQPSVEPTIQYSERDMHRLRYHVKRKHFQIQAHREEINRLQSDLEKMKEELKRAEMQNTPIEVIVPKKRMSNKAAREEDEMARKIIEMLLAKGIVSKEQVDAAR